MKFPPNTNMLNVILQENEEDALEESSKPKRTKADKKEETHKKKKTNEENNSKDKKTIETGDIELEPKNCEEVDEHVEAVEVQRPKEESRKEEFETVKENDLEDGECSETDSDNETEIKNDDDVISNISTSTATDDGK